MKYFEAKARNKSSSFREQEIQEPVTDDTLWPTEFGQLDGDGVADKEFDLTARTTSLLNLDSFWLADVLSEKPTQASKKGPGPQVSEKVAVPVSNNNFSLLF